MLSVNVKCYRFRANHPLQAAANNKNTPCKPLPVAAAEAEMKNAPHRGVFLFWFTSCAEKQKDKFRLLASGFEKKLPDLKKRVIFACFRVRAGRV